MRASAIICPLVGLETAYYKLQPSNWGSMGGERGARLSNSALRRHQYFLFSPKCARTVPEFWARTIPVFAFLAPFLLGALKVSCPRTNTSMIPILYNPRREEWRCAHSLWVTGAWSSYIRIFLSILYILIRLGRDNRVSFYSPASFFFRPLSKRAFPDGSFFYHIHTATHEIPR